MSTNTYCLHGRLGDQLCPDVHEWNVHPEMGRSADWSIVTSDFSLLTWYTCFDRNRIGDFIRGHTNLSVTTLIEALAPGWDVCYAGRRRLTTEIFLVQRSVIALCWCHTKSWKQSSEPVSLKIWRFWCSWSFDCSSNIDRYFMHGSKMKALISQDMMLFVVVLGFFK